MILHEFDLSSASYRVRIALNIKGLAYEQRSYRLRAGEQRSAAYLAINPAGLVPTLEVDGLRLTQSLAIIDYLEAKWPEPALLPRDAAARARALSMAHVISSDIHPLNNLRVLEYLEHQLGADEAARARWISTWIHSGFVALEAALAEQPEHAYAIGEAPGLVDLCIVPQVFNARRYSVDLTAYPRLVAIADRAAAHPAFVKAAPSV
jgi:maleylacetoacetate isomerase